MITTAAHEINGGRPPHLEPEEGQDHDFFFIDRPNPERALETVVEVVAERVPGRFGLDPIRDVQVLAPMYRGAVGIDALNERLQERLNPKGKPALNGRFRLGDRLIQTRNAHELGLMNGSIVFLRADDPEEETIAVDTDDGGSLVIPYDETATLRLAYAISVHKAQGCEVPVVVGVCHRSHTRMLTRPLLYTAITRARSTCVLVGDHGGAARGDRPRRRRRPPLLAGRAPARLSRRGGRRPGRPPLAAIGVTLAGIALLAGLVLAVPELHHAFDAARPRRLRRGPRPDRRPRRRRAAADRRPDRDPRGRLLPGRDHRRRGRLRLRLLAGAGADDGRLAALRAAQLRDRPLGRAAAARPLVRRRALRAGRGDGSSAAARRC